jgi:hypothetical protein
MAEGKSAIVQPASDTVVDRLGETEITRRGISWLPVSQLIIWSLFSRASRQRNPDRSWLRAGLEGFCQMMIMLGSEWGHNLAHLVASHMVDKPMDQFRIQLGMPRCVYHKINDQGVTPREHVTRALGGPLFNLLALPFAWIGKQLTKKSSIAGMTARTAFDTNLFLTTVSLLPIPGIDGGPILKWTLVDRGKTSQEADEVVRKTNGPLALLLGLVSSAAFLKKKPLLGLFSLMLGGISLSIFTGWLKEEDISI